MLNKKEQKILKSIVVAVVAYCDFLLAKKSID